MLKDCSFKISSFPELYVCPSSSFLKPVNSPSEPGTLSVTIRCASRPPIDSLRQGPIIETFMSSLYSLSSIFAAVCPYRSRITTSKFLCRPSCNRPSQSMVVYPKPGVSMQCFIKCGTTLSCPRSLKKEFKEHFFPFVVAFSKILSHCLEQEMLRASFIFNIFMNKPISVATNARKHTGVIQSAQFFIPATEFGKSEQRCCLLHLLFRTV